MEKEKFEKIVSLVLAEKLRGSNFLLTTYEERHVACALQLRKDFEEHEKRIRSIPGHHLENENGSLRAGLLKRPEMALRNCLMTKLCYDSRNVLRNSLWILVNYKRIHIDVDDVTHFRLYKKYNLDLLLKKFSKGTGITDMSVTVCSIEPQNSGRVSIRNHLNPKV